MVAYVSVQWYMRCSTLLDFGMNRVDLTEMNTWRFFGPTFKLEWRTISLDIPERKSQLCLCLTIQIVSCITLQRLSLEMDNTQSNLKSKKIVSKNVQKCPYCLTLSKFPEKTEKSKKSGKFESPESWISLKSSESPKIGKSGNRKVRKVEKRSTVEKLLKVRKFRKVKKIPVEKSEKSGK